MRAWGSTDRGMVRKSNQDCFSVEAIGEQLLAVVCDGMGGHNAGDVASAMALDVFTKLVKASAVPGMTPEQMELLLRGAVDQANRAVLEESMTSPVFSGMGTTLVAALVTGNQAVVVNVGDSRAYHVSPGSIRQITRDHSVVAMMVENGELTPQEAETFPGRNMITRAVGTEETVNSDVFQVTMEPGDCLLLCSDGLSNLVLDAEMHFEVIHGVQLDTCCRRLIQIAQDRGAPDNVTAVVVTTE